MTRILVGLFPALAIVVCVVVAALPWGFAPDWRFVLPGGVYAVVHHFAVSDPERVPEWLVFGAGLSLDVLTGGPLGYWSLVYLVGYVVAVLQAPPGSAQHRSRSDNRLARWLKFALALAVVAGFEWFLASVYFLQAADARPYLAAASVLVLIYPLLSAVIEAVETPLRRRAGPLSGFGSHPHGS